MHLGFVGNDMQAFSQVNQESFRPIANTFVNRLINTTILERDWASHPNLYRLNPEMAKSLEYVVRRNGLGDPIVVRRHDTTSHQAGLTSTLIGMYDKGLADQRRNDLSRKPGGGIAGGDDG